MIRLTRPDGSSLFLNAEMIESVESTPDTVIRYGNQRCLLVRESSKTVVARIIRYRRLLAKGGDGRGSRVARC
jgi:flagellar protein FlbD